MLRHSFISYRITLVKSADQVALEAGNTATIIFKNYRELTTEEQANKNRRFVQPLPGAVFDTLIPNSTIHPVFDFRPRG